MRTDLAIYNLLHSLPRTIVAVSGIGVAVVLIFMQLGFLGAVESTATSIYDRMRFDLIVRSPDYLHFADAGTIRRSILSEIASIDGVDSVVPFHVGFGGWLDPAHEKLRGIMIIGVDPQQPAFDDPEITKDLNRLTHPSFVLMDTKSHPEFGPADGVQFGPPDIGRTSELTRKQASIVGLFTLGSGLTANGTVITSESGFRNFVMGRGENNVSFGLVRLKPGVSAKQMRDQLVGSRHFRDVVDVLGREEVRATELKRWIKETPIGFVFSLGVLISFVVGAAIFYMVLATDIGNRISEFATLKAMGYANWRLSMLVLRQAMYLSLFAFVPSVIAATICYGITASLANIPIEMTWDRLAMVFLLTLLMCAVSGILALRKLFQAEPAALF